MRFLNRSVVDHPWLTIVLFLAVTAVITSRIPDLHIESDVSKAIPQSHPEVQYNDWLEDYFGIEDPAVFIIVNDGPDGVFAPETLALVQHISERLAVLDGIDGEDVVSLSAVDNITGEGDLLTVEPFFEEAPATREEAQAIRRAVFDNPMMVGTVVSKDGHATVVLGEIEEGVDKSPLYLKLKDIVAGAPVVGERVLLSGRPVIEVEVGDQARADLGFMFPLVVLAAGLLLFLSLRSVRGVLLPLLVVVSSVGWSLGLMVWTGETFYPMTTLMPTLLVAIGVANGIHIIHHFMLGVAEHPGRPVGETVFDTMEQMMPPVLMTSLTTAAGLGSLAASPMKPVQGVGIYSAAGVLAAMVFSVTLLPAVLTILPLPRKAALRTAGTQTEKGGVVAMLLETLTPLVIRWPLVSVAAAVVVVVVGAAGIPRLRVDSSLVANFPEGNPVKLADEEFVEYFDGSVPLNVVLDAGEDDAWKRPENLRAMEGLQDYMEAAGYMGETRALADYVKRMNAVMMPDDPEGDRIPDSQDLVAQYLLIYTMSGEPDDFDDVVDYGYRTANVRAQLSSDHSPVLKQAIADIEGYAAEHLAPLGIETHASGIGRISYTFVELLVKGQIRSLILALVIVVVLAALMCRSVAAGFFTVLPVAVATVLNFGLMGWFNVPLEVPTALLSSLGIGIGVDYAIHFVFRYRRDRRAAMSREDAMHETLSTSGVAIFYNAMVVLAGFLVMATSAFPPNHALGVLVAQNMFVCFLGTVTLLAAALHLIQPAFVRPPAEVVPLHAARRDHDGSDSEAA